MTSPEIILSEPEHAFLVAGIVRALRKPERQTNDHRHAVLVELKLAGLDAETPIVTGNLVSSARYAALTDALATHQPDPSTLEIEPWQVVNALGQHGNIWPACVLADRVDAPTVPLAA